MQRRAQRGFTLIELMIALVIVAIITSIAATTFSGADKDGERAKVISEMVALNDAMGRYYQGSYSYDGATIDILRTQMGSTIPEGNSYEITVDVDGDGQGYTLTARPKNDTMRGEGAYSMDEAGLRCSFPGNDAGVHPGDGGECRTKW